MSAVSDSPRDPEAERAEALLSTFAAAGYERVEPPILQPASVFLDQSGEDIRGRLYLTSDATGADLCLRPEYTIPVCRAYLAATDARAQAAYYGPVFRHHRGSAGEFTQTGIESFGRTDREAADAEIMTLALEAAQLAGHGPLEVRLGDTGLFARLLDALSLSPVWTRRIRRAHAKGDALAALAPRPSDNGDSDHSGVLAVLEGVDKQGARALVQDLLTIAGISSVGGRTATEIAERFLDQGALKAESGFHAGKRVVLERFLKIEGHPDAASADMRALAADAKLDLGAALDAFDARLGFIAAHGYDVGKLTFAAGFGRNLDYYTGFVFQGVDPARRADGPMVGGGRYDKLLRMLGAASDVPAVGAAIWVDRAGAEMKA